jgi:integrase
MSIWKTKYGWRYQFMHQRQEYSKSGFRTKATARAAEAAHKAQLKKEVLAKNKTGMVFSELANEYLDYAARRFVVKTYKAKAAVFRAFIHFAGDVPVQQICLSIFESYLHTRPGNINYNRHRKELCTLLNWAWRRRKIDENPCLWLEKMPEAPFTKTIPTQDEMRRLLLAAGEDRPLILILYHTLARIDEVLRLRWQDVNFQDRAVTLWTRKRKGGEWAGDTMAMNQVLYDTLWGLWRTRSQDEWLFFNTITGTRFMRRPKLMRTLCKIAGIRYFGFHAIRHYVASLLHDSKKVSLPQVSKLLRHQSKATTERYLQVIDAGSREAMASLETEFFGGFPQQTTSTENQ